MKYRVYVFKDKNFNTGIIVKVDTTEDMSGWELVGETRTKAEAKELFKAIPNCWNN